MLDNGYYVFYEGKFNRILLGDLAKRLSLPIDIPISTYSNDGSYGAIWSARLSTGLFGLTSCESGNSGPKGYSEVILATEDEGLIKLVDLGFITCPICCPEKIDDFWETVEGTVKAKHNLLTLTDFIDKRILPFDTRRIKWEELLPVIDTTPNRLYVPNNLSDDDLRKLNGRFADIGFTLPPTGYYNPDVPERFTQYQIVTS